MNLFGRSTALPTAETALPGRDQPLVVAPEHLVLHHPMTPPYPDGTEIAVFGMGCFWGIERLFWRMPGVWTTAAGYAGGWTRNPTYQEVCSGRTGHTEVVLVVYDPSVVTYDVLLKAFWENHDPTQGMRQWNDVGTQYRSAIYTSNQAQFDAAVASRDAYQGALRTEGYGEITTQIQPLEATSGFFYAEDYHQQYLQKNPGGYCDMHGTGIACSITGTQGLGVAAS
ncbi:peptide-methionine (S)-S-oxide reductase MsrA [Nakamurella endophytica]|uniref:Peptide methionine sulfoxide reductase MsrA n=1 Tax=Nakamurella endophytica TaxID=1748367 RepID=A0A917WKE0_9ACTN|nr:peptide-methionine (S)-S-oxide reductase MsrA [Nakamurella endophytica]GGM10627.1 peptide methionine sulfoxide reductase MsrA [Nakamurella endophytica]